jgi:hypothetical protein
MDDSGEILHNSSADVSSFSSTDKFVSRHILNHN